MNGGLLFMSKQELIGQGSALDCCKRALLSGYFHAAGSVLLSADGIRILIYPDSEALLKKLAGLCATLYGLSVEEREGREVLLSGDAGAALVDLHILGPEGGRPAILRGVPKAFFASPCCRVNYLRGAFLGAGSLSDANGYRLSITVNARELAEGLQAILSLHGIAASVSKKKDRFCLYLSDLENVSDCLALLGAGETVLHLQSESVFRTVRQNANRALNCEMGNIGKLVDTSLRQTEAIQRLRESGGFDSLPAKLKEAAELRISYPEDSLSTLAARMNLSKSALKYRLEQVERRAKEWPHRE